MVKKVLWILMAVLSVFIGLYPSKFFMGDKKVGILQMKPDALFLNPWWQTGFYLHIILGGLALLIGWMQFSPGIRNKWLTFHRQTGKLYVMAVLISALSGFYIAFYASGGVLTMLGFMSLSIAWFYTTAMAYVRIRQGRVEPHRQLMIYSYACCFAAVTLRLWMPFLFKIFGDFGTAYMVVAWWCWVPNLVVAYFIARAPVGKVSH